MIKIQRLAIENIQGFVLRATSAIFNCTKNEVCHEGFISANVTKSPVPCSYCIHYFIFCSVTRKAGNILKTFAVFNLQTHVLLQYKISFNYYWQKPVNSDNENRFTDNNIDWKSFDTFQPSFAFYIETSYLICSANQLTGFYTKSTPVWNCLNCLKFDHDQSKPSQYLLI